ncbi:MAG TPA: PP2C family protein-serine/threonine phosphatase, partial [Ignavibacteriaceae bacterium]|nr:PP2C family protein-serine/threonine phosphatase [Ignavibacteriaceae bacterium]
VVKYSGAGDLPLMLKDFKKNEVKVIKSDGMLLGFAADGFFEDTVIEMNEDDFLVLMTDGIIESRNESGVPLGSDNFAKMINVMPSNNDPMEFLQTQFSIFTNHRYEDDISLITIRLKS